MHAARPDPMGVLTQANSPQILRGAFDCMRREFPFKNFHREKLILFVLSDGKDMISSFRQSLRNFTWCLFVFNLCIHLAALCLCYLINLPS